MPPDDLNLNLEDTLIPPTTAATEEAAPPTVDPPVQQETQQESLPSSLLMRAQQAGLPLDGIDNHEKLSSYLLDRYMQDRAYADYGRSAISAGPQNPQSAAAPQQSQEPADVFDEDSYFSSAWTVPTLSPGAQFALDNGVFRVNEQGMIAPAEGLEQMALPYLKEVNDYQQAKAQQNQAFAANPVKFIYEKLMPALEHRFDGRYREQVQERFQQYEHQNFEQKFIAENGNWLYTPDKQAWTPEGLRFRDAVAELRQQGITDPQRLADWAMKIAQVKPTPPGGTEAATPPAGEGRVRNEQGQFVKAAGMPPTPPPTKQESFIEGARRKAAVIASQGSSEMAAADSVVANQGELDNIWDTAWRKHKQGAAA